MSSPELTCREMEVRLVVTGLSNKEIGTTLYIGEGTVRTHINNILSKWVPAMLRQQPWQSSVVSFV